MVIESLLMYLRLKTKVKHTIGTIDMGKIVSLPLLFCSGDGSFE